MHMYKWWTIHVSPVQDMQIKEIAVFIFMFQYYLLDQHLKELTYILLIIDST